MLLTFELQQLNRSNMFLIASKSSWPLITWTFHGDLKFFTALTVHSWLGIWVILKDRRILSKSRFRIVIGLFKALIILVIYNFNNWLGMYFLLWREVDCFYLSSFGECMLKLLFKVNIFAFVKFHNFSETVILLFETNDLWFILSHNLLVSFLQISIFLF